jgi:hypothetical protein
LSVISALIFKNPCRARVEHPMDLFNEFLNCVAGQHLVYAPGWHGLAVFSSCGIRLTKVKICSVSGQAKHQIRQRLQHAAGLAGTEAQGVTHTFQPFNFQGPFAGLLQDFPLFVEFSCQPLDQQEPGLVVKNRFGPEGQLVSAGIQLCPGAGVQASGARLTPKFPCVDQEVLEKWKSLFQTSNGRRFRTEVLEPIRKHVNRPE